MNLKQVQIQTQTKPTAAELIKEIAETYVNERGWADVREVLPALENEDVRQLGISLVDAVEDLIAEKALADKHCPFCGEELKRVVVRGYVNYRCWKCMEDWQESEVGPTE